MGWRALLVLAAAAGARGAIVGFHVDDETCRWARRHSVVT